MVRPNSYRATIVAIATLVACGCGARTGLEVPETGTGGQGLALTAPVCTPGHFDLRARTTEIMFVIDRSGSMGMVFDTRSGHTRRRWDALRDALAVGLPPFEAELAIGAAIFPIGPNSCGTSQQATVEPEFRSAGRILAALATYEPGGDTPTYDAVRAAYALLERRAALGHARFVVLATDGGPTCHPLDRLAYDVDRTVAAIAEGARRGTPTFVLGLDDPSEPMLAETLDRMAIAGGRPNLGPGQPRYFSVRDDTALAQALHAVQTAVSRCVFTVPARPEDSDVTLEIDGAPVAHDPSRIDGWDWTGIDTGELTLFGDACTRAAPAGARVRASIVCTGGR